VLLVAHRLCDGLGLGSSILCQVAMDIDRGLARHEGVHGGGVLERHEAEAAGAGRDLVEDDACLLYGAVRGERLDQVLGCGLRGDTPTCK
jgi:hypothetical protein